MSSPCYGSSGDGGGGGKHPWNYGGGKGGSGAQGGASSSRHGGKKKSEASEAAAVFTGAIFVIYASFFNAQLGGEMGLLLQTQGSYVVRSFPSVTNYGPVTPYVGMISQQSNETQGGGGQGAVIPFEGFMYDEEQMYVIRRILNLARPPGVEPFPDQFLG